MSAKSVDLHLLPHFDALVRTANVSRAADLLGISQPAMSGALGRLRELLGDPILIRSGHAMVLTQRALELHGALAPLLEQWLEATEPFRSFAPDASTRTFSLVASDYVQFLLLPRLAAALEGTGPRARLKVLPVNPIKTLEMLESGHVEFVIGHVDNSPRFAPQPSAVRGGGRLLGASGPPGALAVLGAGHLRTVPPRAGDVERVSQLQHRRRADARGARRPPRRRDDVSSYLATPHIVAASDLIATLPGTIAAEFARTLPVAVLPLPVAVPAISIALFWHERNQKDPAHRWLRELVASPSLPWLLRPDGRPTLARPRSAAGLAARQLVPLRPDFPRAARSRRRPTRTLAPGLLRITGVGPTTRQILECSGGPGRKGARSAARAIRGEPRLQPWHHH